MVKTDGNIQTLLKLLSHFSLLILFTSVNTFAQKPELVVQTGHSSGVKSVAFSPDGKLLASGSWDQTIRLWDVANGTELRSLKGGTVFSVAFSPDGKLLASGSDDKTIKLWDVASGRELRTFSGHAEWVSSVAFSPDGKLLASGSGDHQIKLWDVAGGDEIRSLNGYSNWVYSVAFSPDGKMLASGGWELTGLRQIKLWDVAGGKEIRSFAGGTSNFVSSVAFSPDGRLLASVDGHGKIKLWDISGGEEIRSLSGRSDQINSVAFSPDGKLLASGSAGNAIKLWDVASGYEMQSFSGRSTEVRDTAFSPDGKLLASGSGDDTIRVWDLVSGNQIRWLKARSEKITALTFGPHGKLIASASDDLTDYTIQLWDVASGKVIRSLTGHSNPVYSVAFSPDGKLLASGSGDHQIKLWDVAGGDEIRSLSGHSSWVTSVAFSPDGKLLASSSDDKTIKLWDVASGKEKRTLSGHSEQVISVAFSPDGRFLASGGSDDSVKLWDTGTGKEIQSLNAHSAVYSVAFSPDGRLLASGGWELKGSAHIKLWDVAGGTEIRSFKGHTHFVNSVAFSPDGKLLASGSADAKTKFWEVATGKELASLISLDRQDWLVITPDGLFDGSPAAWGKILWRFSWNLYDVAPIEIFFNEFYHPGLLTEISAGRRPKATGNISQKDRRQPQVKLSRSDGQSPDIVVATRSVSVTVDVSQAQAGAQDVRLFRNGSLVKAWHGDVLQGQANVTLKATVPIVAGENRLTAYAFNRDNIKSADATFNITGADSLRRKGTAYVLTIGVNEYANAQYNLRYAVADAQAFGEEVKNQQEKLSNYKRVEIIPIYDRKATKSNILKNLKQLAAEIQPEDAVVVYFAGHGMAARDRFYLIPHDLGARGPRKQTSQARLDTILAQSISDRELEKVFEGIDAGQILLVIDACNSGQALEAEEKRRGPMNSKGLAQLAYEKGMYILTAAQSYQAAQEAARLGHGYLTYALVEEGLKKGEADKEPQDGLVLVREWLNHATERVPQMQEEAMVKSLRSRGLNIAFVEGEEKIKEPAKRSVQRPRVFYRRELEAQPLIIAKPKMPQQRN